MSRIFSLLTLASLLFLTPLVSVRAEVLPRLVLVKVDGLSPLVLDAAVDPRDPATGRLPHPELFREAHSQLQSVVGRDTLLPNIEAYFYRNGVRAKMFCGTLPVSTPSWAVIDTGQHSIVKSNSYFDRFTGDLASYLDQFRESLSVTVKGAGRTTALWQLDLLNIPLLSDFFPEERVWTSIQPFYRKRPTDQLGFLGKHLITRGEKSKNPFRLIKRHLGESAYGPDYPEKNDQALASLASDKIFETDLEGNETLDFLSFIFSSVDHQFHVDPHYENILSWLMRVDDWIGEILAAIEQSGRRDSTVVVLLSDHGLDFDPVRINYSFPINRWLREVEFGGHTVLAPVVEDTEHALTVPVRGVDFTRLYESPASAFGPEVPYGEKGFATAYTDNTGNPRFDAFLRNSDLNRLHLLMLEVLRHAKRPETLEFIFPEFSDAFAAVQEWVEEEIRQSLRAAHGLEEISKTEFAEPDAAERLSKQSTAYRRVAFTLARLATVPVEKDGWLEWARRGFRIGDFIPKGYFGPTNSLEQLQGYVSGWQTPPDSRWKGPTAYRRIDYTKLFTTVEATSANAWGNKHPFHFFSAAVPVESLAQHFDRPLGQALWLVFRSAQAIILESEDGDLLYRPLESLAFAGESILLKPLGDPARDPFGYSHLANRWMSLRSWARESTGDAEWQMAPIILAELFRDNFRLGGGATDTGEEAEFAKEFHFAQQKPDFRVWTCRGWNVNSNSHTPGGSHGNFTELDVRTLFAVWGGADYRLRRGELLPGAFLTFDIVPTLLSIAIPATNRDRSLNAANWVGEVIPILESPEAGGSNRTEGQEK